MTAPPTRIRIHSYLSPTHFLHVEDATAIGKVRLFAGTYRPGSGATFLLHHFVDIPDMRVLCHALISQVIGYHYTEYKGTLLDATHATSRVLRLQTRKAEVWWDLSTGPGTLTRQGTIVPDAEERDRTVRIQVPLSWHAAQALAHAVTAFLHAWDVVRALHHVAQWQPLPEYATATIAHDQPEVITYSDDGDALPPDLAPPPALLRATYGDGSTVSPATPEEYAAFHAYLRTRNLIPPSRAVLLRWARARRAPASKKGSRQ